MNEKMSQQSVVDKKTLLFHAYLRRGKGKRSLNTRDYNVDRERDLKGTE